QVHDDVVPLQSGPLRRGAPEDVLDDHALLVAEAEALGDLGRHVRQRNAHHGALHRAVSDELLGDVAGQIDGDREADALAARVDGGGDGDRPPAEPCQAARPLARSAAGARRVPRKMLRLRRPWGLMMPTVTEPRRSPSGWPIAMAQSPIRSCSESPSGSTGRFEPSILITATSVAGSVPTVAALNVRPSL